MANLLNTATLIDALKNCIEALDEAGHSVEMSRALTCDNRCWQCDAVAVAAALVAEYEALQADA